MEVTLFAVERLFIVCPAEDSMAVHSALDADRWDVTRSGPRRVNAVKVDTSRAQITAERIVSSKVFDSLTEAQAKTSGLLTVKRAQEIAALIRRAEVAEQTARTLQAELEAAREEIKVSDKLLAERNRLLHAIPECQEHGSECVPHAIEWVEKAKSAGYTPRCPRCAGYDVEAQLGSDGMDFRCLRCRHEWRR